MRKNLLATLCLLIISTGSTFAQTTTILTPLKNPVQCNKWGWISDFPQTAWEGACTPLEVRSFDGEVYSVASTAGLCGDNEVAVFGFVESRHEINYMGCFPNK